MLDTCVIFGARPVGLAALRHVPRGAYVIAADAGWQHARALGVKVDIAMGDFDSAPHPQGLLVLESPAEKDDTDTMLAVKHALEKGARRVVLLGCMGGRPDHAYANLQTLLFLAKQGVENLMADEATWITCRAPGSLVLWPQPGHYLSVFAAEERAMGVCLEGLKYPLVNHTLTADMPLGVSNEFLQGPAAVRHGQGYLLVMCTPKDTPEAKA